MLSGPTPALLQQHFAELEEQGRQELADEGLIGEPTHLADLRYAGQGYELTLPNSESLFEDFHDVHRRRYGYADPSSPIEVVTVRVRFVVASDPITMKQQTPRPGDGSAAILRTRPIYFAGEWIEAPIYDRDRLMAGDRISGPALVTEYSATTVLPPGCSAELDSYGNIIVEMETT